MKSRNTIVLTLILAGLLAGPSWAAKADKPGSKDHPLFSRIPGYYISSYQDIEFDQESFPAATGKVVVEGRKFAITYKQPKGEKKMSRLQKVKNYTQAIKKIGGEVLRDNKSSATMMIKKDQREIYVQVSNPYGANSYLLTIVEKGTMRQDVVAHSEALDAAPRKAENAITDRKPDKPGSQDHPLVSRIPDYYISSYTDVEFAKHTFKTAKGKEAMEGRKFEITYKQQKGAQAMSALQKVRNYTQAIRKIGGEVLREENSFATMRATADGRNIWLEVSNPYGQGSYHLVIIEQGMMEQEVTASAEAMLNDIRNTGHVAVYGIHFDTGKATLKPSSKPAFQEITKLLKKDLKLNIYVIGHTDMVGKEPANMSLSNARAASVVEELTTRYKIKSKRLTPRGVGPLCPVNSNRSRDGKAQNRRVELVEKI